MFKSGDCSPFKNPLCIALDVDTDIQAMELFDQLKGLAGGFKLGPRLIHRYGQALVQKMAQESPIFVDCKFFDIPSTMAAAVQATFDSGASLCTVHALAGAEALRGLAHLEKELNQKRPFRILAVTVLTSWNENSFPTNFKHQGVSQHVRDLAELVRDAGLQSVVCSTEEIDLLKDLGLYLLTPGIRLPTDSKSDQKRVMGPKEAIEKGSSALVVGRPIIENAKPDEAAKTFLSLIQ